MLGRMRGRRVWVDIEAGEEKEQRRFEADHMSGCDGSRSAVRHALSGRDWPGVTHGHHLVVQNVRSVRTQCSHFR